MTSRLIIIDAFPDANRAGAILIALEELGVLFEMKHLEWRVLVSGRPARLFPPRTVAGSQARCEQMQKARDPANVIADGSALYRFYFFVFDSISCTDALTSLNISGRCVHRRPSAAIYT